MRRNHNRPRNGGYDLWLLENPGNRGYAALVVVACNKEQASLVGPSPSWGWDKSHCRWIEVFLHRVHERGTELWPAPKDVIVTHIGKADWDLEPSQVILAQEFPDG